MKNKVLLIIGIMGLVLVGCSKQSQTQNGNFAPYTETHMRTASGASITSFEAKGNLQSSHNLDCISINQMKNEYTPADLFPAYAKCVREKRYDEAGELFSIAGAYSYFDSLRVADRTSHGAGQILIIQISASLKDVSEEHKIWYKKYLDKHTNFNSPEHLKLCGDIKKVGKPNYYPSYMIQHGMAAFRNNNNPLVEKFNSDEAWKMTLNKYLHCPI